MERRRDTRHPARYPLSLKDLRDSGVVNVQSGNVSASGLFFTTDAPLDLRSGDRLEVQLLAPVQGSNQVDMLVMATHAVVVRVGEMTGALEFEAPFVY